LEIEEMDQGVRERDEAKRGWVKGQGEAKKGRVRGDGSAAHRFGKSGQRGELGAETGEVKEGRGMEREK
jgi:hypothetical protein